MFYSLAKILTFITQPSSVLFLLLVSGLVLSRWEARRRLAFRLGTAGAIGVLCAGILPLGNALILPLEQRFANTLPLPAGTTVTGIILLGGFEDGWVSGGRGGLAVNESAERLTEGLRLALRHPEAKIVFTGAVGGLMSGGGDAAGPVGELLKDYGIAADRVVLEPRARNTYENALFTRDLVKPKPDEHWVLITSAYHIPRSVGTFRQLGFEIIPYPVDYRTRGPIDLKRLFESIGDGLKRTDLGAKEWAGLLAYRLTGRTSEVLPSPLSQPGRAPE